jgi:hypothetical protein
LEPGFKLGGVLGLWHAYQLPYFGCRLSREGFLKLIEEGKFSGEEDDDKELLIALDEWISL